MMMLECDTSFATSRRSPELNDDKCDDSNRTDVVDDMVGYDEQLAHYRHDPDYRELMAWRVTGDYSSRSANNEEALFRYRRQTVPPALTAEDVAALRGSMIVLEGGIAQGKTSMARAMVGVLKTAGVPCHMAEEPVDAESLRLFMKYGTWQPSNEDLATMSPRLIAERTEARRRASVRMQFSMLRARAMVLQRAAQKAREGWVAIADRGPFGDAAFMSVTFGANRVPEDVRLAYVAEFQRLYLGAGLPTGRTAVVHFSAPVSRTHPRWLHRERAVPGNKYDPGYLQRIEHAHSVCSLTWGRCVEYDDEEAIPGASEAPPGKDAATALLKELAARLTAGYFA